MVIATMKHLLLPATDETPIFSTVLSASCPHNIENTASHPIGYDFSVETTLFRSFKAGMGRELEDLTNLVLFFYSV